MKNLILILFCTLFVLNAQIIQAKEITNSSIATITVSNQLSITEKTSLINRVNEIRYMDKSKLTTGQKSDLRDELIGIKQKLADPFTGIYLSAGAIIIILLVLLIILR